MVMMKKKGAREQMNEEQKKVKGIRNLQLVKEIL